MGHLPHFFGFLQGGYTDAPRYNGKRRQRLHKFRGAERELDKTERISSSI